MPARVEYRLGSIFDQECDVLVIPSSAGGTVSPSMAAQLREQGLPFPTAMSWGSVTLESSPSPKFGVVAYASTLRGVGTTADVVRAIGQRLGSIAIRRQANRISAPLLGAGAGDLPPAAAADALAGGFLETAPATAVLTISIRRPEVLARLSSSEQENAVSRGDVVSIDEQDIQLYSARPARRREASAPAPPPERPRSETRGRKRVFISYSHADAEWLERLQKHLRPLEREGALIWDDTRLKAGARWRDEIRAALAETKVAILLISADFLASDFITTDELPPLLKAAEEDGATILPVIISPSRFDRIESLSCFQAVNDPQKPLVQMRKGNREKELDRVARAVEDALKR